MKQQVFNGGKFYTCKHRQHRTDTPFVTVSPKGACVERGQGAWHASKGGPPGDHRWRTGRLPAVTTAGRAPDTSARPDIPSSQHGHHGAPPHSPPACWTPASLSSQALLVGMSRLSLLPAVLTESSAPGLGCPASSCTSPTPALPDPASKETCQLFLEKSLQHCFSSHSAEGPCPSAQPPLPLPAANGPWAAPLTPTSSRVRPPL